MYRFLHLIALLSIIASSLGLFQLKFYVQDLNRELIEVKRQLNEEKDNLVILKAEWAHLNNSERLKYLAEKYLDLDQIRVSQISTSGLLTKLEEIQQPQGNADNLRLVVFNEGGDEVKIRSVSY